MPLKWAMRTFCNTTLMAQDLTTSQIERQNILNNRILRFAPEIDFASKTTCSILPSKSSGTLGRRKYLIINDGVFPMNCFCVHRERVPPFYGPVGHIGVPDDLLGNRISASHSPCCITLVGTGKGLADARTKQRFCAAAEISRGFGETAPIF